MFIEEIKLKLNTKANIKQYYYNVVIYDRYNLEIGKIIHNKEEDLLILRDINVLFKKPYTKPEDIEIFLVENLNDLVFRYLLRE